MGSNENEIAIYGRTIPPIHPFQERIIDHLQEEHKHYIPSNEIPHRILWALPFYFFEGRWEARVWDKNNPKDPRFQTVSHSEGFKDEYYEKLKTFKNESEKNRERAFEIFQSLTNKHKRKQWTCLKEEDIGEELDESAYVYLCCKMDTNIKVFYFHLPSEPTDNLLEVIYDLPKETSPEVIGERFASLITGLVNASKEDCKKSDEPVSLEKIAPVQSMLGKTEYTDIQLHQLQSMLGKTGFRSVFLIQKGLALDNRDIQLVYKLTPSQEYLMYQCIKDYLVRYPEEIFSGSMEVVIKEIHSRIKSEVLGLTVKEDTAYALACTTMFLADDRSEELKNKLLLSDLDLLGGSSESEIEIRKTNRKQKIRSDLKATREKIIEVLLVDQVHILEKIPQKGIAYSIARAVIKSKLIFPQVIKGWENDLRMSFKENPQAVVWLEKAYTRKEDLAKDVIEIPFFFGNSFYCVVVIFTSLAENIENAESLKRFYRDVKLIERRLPWWRGALSSDIRAQLPLILTDTKYDINEAIRKAEEKINQINDSRLPIIQIFPTSHLGQEYDEKWIKIKLENWVDDHYKLEEKFRWRIIEYINNAMKNSLIENIPSQERGILERNGNNHPVPPKFSFYLNGGTSIVSDLTDCWLMFHLVKNTDNKDTHNPLLAIILEYDAKYDFRSEADSYDQIVRDEILKVIKESLRQRYIAIEQKRLGADAEWASIVRNIGHVIAAPLNRLKEDLSDLMENISDEQAREKIQQIRHRLSGTAAIKDLLLFFKEIESLGEERKWEYALRMTDELVFGDALKDLELNRANLEKWIDEAIHYVAVEGKRDHREPEKAKYLLKNRAELINIDLDLPGVSGPSLSITRRQRGSKWSTWTRVVDRERATIRIAVQELCINAIKYANPVRPAFTVKVIMVGREIHIWVIGTRDPAKPSVLSLDGKDQTQERWSGLKLVVAGIRDGLGWKIKPLHDSEVCQALGCDPKLGVDTIQAFHIVAPFIGD